MKARHGWPEDLDGNGSFVEADRNIGVATPAGKTIGEGAYNVLMDFDFSGTIEQDEYDRCQSGTGIAALDAGAISDPDFGEGPWSAAGDDGYIYDDIADLSCVRFRWYDAGLERWMTRDPAGYAEGKPSYRYVSGNPEGRVDPQALRYIERSFNAFPPGRLGHWLPEPFAPRGFFSTDIRGFGEFDHETARTGAPASARLYHVSRNRSTDDGSRASRWHCAVARPSES